MGKWTPSVEKPHQSRCICLRTLAVVSAPLTVLNFHSTGLRGSLTSQHHPYTPFLSDTWNKVGIDLIQLPVSSSGNRTRWKDWVTKCAAAEWSHWLWTLCNCICIHPALGDDVSKLNFDQCVRVTYSLSHGGCQILGCARLPMTLEVTSWSWKSHDGYIRYGP